MYYSSSWSKLTKPQYCIHYTLYIIYYTLYIIHYTIYIIHYTIYIIHYTKILLAFSNVRLNVFFYNFVLGFIILFVQYDSVICRPSDHTVGRLRAEIRTRAGWIRDRDTTPRPPRLLQEGGVKGTVPQD